MPLMGISRVGSESAGECSVTEFEFEFAEVSVAGCGGAEVLEMAAPAFRSRTRRLLGGNESRSVLVCLVAMVELLVLLPSPAPVLEQELASSWGFPADCDTFSTEKKKRTRIRSGVDRQGVERTVRIVCHLIIGVTGCLNILVGCRSIVLLFSRTFRDGSTFSLFLRIHHRGSRFEDSSTIGDASTVIVRVRR